MRNRLLRLLLCLLSPLGIMAQAAAPLEFTDVDQHKFSPGDGHITILVLIKKDELDKARLVGDRVPATLLGKPDSRFVTVIQFEKKLRSTTRSFYGFMARRRLDAEAKRLQIRYAENNLSRDARQDVHVVLDFDGTVAAGLGLAAQPPTFHVIVLGRKGEIVRQWNNVPPAEEFAAALR